MRMIAEWIEKYLHQKVCKRNKVSLSNIHVKPLMDSMHHSVCKVESKNVSMVECFIEEGRSDEDDSRCGKRSVYTRRSRVQKE